MYFFFEKTISIIFVSFLSSIFFLLSNKVLLSETVTRKYRIGHDYSGVHRCGSDQENKTEARIATDNKIRDLIADTGLAVTLVDFEIADHSTRNWEEKDSFGFSKGRKCETHLEIDVFAEIQI